MSRFAPHTRPHLSRRGIQTLELILVTPIVLLAMMSILEFGATIVVQQAVLAAATEAAREAAKGASAPETAGVVETVLSTHGLAVHNTSGVLVVIEDTSGVACEGDATAGNCPITSSVSDPAEVKVTVVVDLDVAPIPRVLDDLGLDLQGQRLEICSIARRPDAL